MPSLVTGVAPWGNAMACSVAFSSWAPGEPNNWGGLQHCAAIKVSEYGTRRMGVWDDVGCEVVEISYRSDGETLGHICEAAGKKML